MTHLNWLHLSDWHQKGKDFDRGVVRDALLKDIRDRKGIAPTLDTIQFVVFSGDLGFFGQTQEFQEARKQLLDPVLKALGLGPERLFMVPGNHDMDRNHVYEMLPPELQKPLASNALVQKWLDDDSKRARTLEPFEHYRAFVTAYTGQASPDYASVLRLTSIGGKEIALLGINSAWMCARHKDSEGEVDDKGYLVVGEPQIEMALQQIAAAEVKIAVLHHPFDWLAEFDRDQIKPLLGRDCHFILHGHEHQPKVHRVDSTDGDYVMIPAGACYDRRNANNQLYVNAYNFVSLDFVTGTGRVYLRRWSEKRRQWIADTDTYDDGQFPLNPLPKQLAKPNLPPINPPPIPTSLELEHEFLQAYRNAIEKLHREIPVAGFKTRLRVRIDLEELYVPLHAMVDRRVTGDSQFADACEAEEKLRAHDSTEIALIDAFREDPTGKRRNLVILGDPGSGKTTHLKRLLLACLRKGPQWLGLPEDTLPVFLPLRELEDLNHGMDAFIEKTLDDPHLGMAKGFGERLLKRGRLLLLFDGLDEVSDPRQRAKVSRWIEGAVKVRDDCTAVVTCRFAGYDKDSCLNGPFLELYLRPLTREQSESFIRNWYHVVETNHSPGSAGEIEALRGAEELIERLRGPDFGSRKMIGMTRNPLLLANLCLVHRDRGGILPKGRHELYNECIDVLLELWRAGDKRLSVSIPAQTARRALQPAALWLHGEENRARASAAELAPVLQTALNAAQWQGGDARRFLQTIRDESGLLTGWGHDHYGFMHLGFQEYLAACELRRLAFEEALAGDKSATLARLAGHYGESWWDEVILLLLAQGNPSLFKPFMTEAVKQDRFAEDNELLGYILAEAAEPSPAPFVELLRQDPGTDTSLWARQLAALKALLRLSPDEIKPLAAILNHHPQAELRGFVREWIGAVASTRRLSLNGGVSLLHIPGGRFMMGSPEGQGYDSERPAHEVEIQPFYLGRYPITNEEYRRYLEANPNAKEPEYWADRRFNQDRQPVVGVDWEETRRFAQWAGGRLPTEAEWEYAARAGSTSRFYWGESEEKAGDYAWYDRNSGDTTHPVGEKLANAFGLGDMAGNVWEWVQDNWHDDYNGAPLDGSAWDDADGGLRVIRGGSWYFEASYLRPAYRYGGNPDVPNFNLSFRLAQDL